MRTTHWLALIFLLMLPIYVLAQDETANVLLREINEARASVNVPPLVINEQLMQAAQRHSDDMADEEVLTHVGSDGSQFWERIQATGYELSTGAENVLSRSDADGLAAFRQWFDSPPHQQNMLNRDYVEAGIGLTQAASDIYYFTLLLASRPGIVAPPLRPTNTQVPPSIPPTVAATATPIPPTNTPQPPATRTLVPTNARAATIAAPLPTNTLAPTSVAAAASNAIATNTALPTATHTPPPPDIRLMYDESSFVLVNIAGRPLNLANLIFESANGSLLASEWNTEFLSQSLTGFTHSDCLQAWHVRVNRLPKPENCRLRHAWITVGDGGLFWQDVETFSVRNGAERVGVCLVDAGFCEINLSSPIDVDMLIPSVAAFNRSQDLRLVYNTDSFALINISGQALDLRGIIFRSSSGEMPVERWNTDFLTQPLSNFTSGDCLQVWGLAASEIYSAPQECDVRHAWIAVGDTFDFWRDTEDFVVIRDNVRIGRCVTTQTICEISLSANFADAVRPSTTTSDTAAIEQSNTTAFSSDVQVLISDTSVTLINTSSSQIDVSAFAFESENAVFVASQWNIESLSRPLNALPAGDCLQVWAVGTELQPKPSDCNVRHAWVAVAVDAQFWLNERVFRVRRGAQILATCETRISICDFDLS